MPDNNEIRRMQNTSTEKISVVNGKIERKGNYITPGEANKVDTVTVTHPTESDPIFDTPPSYKTAPPSDSNIQSLDELKSTSTRTPITPGKPNGSPVIHGGAIMEEKEDVPDPVKLKVVDNMNTQGLDFGSMGSFDTASLPKKKDNKINLEEEEALGELSAAVDNELISISERVDAITKKQYEELMEARAGGRQVARPMSEEELAAEEASKFNNKTVDNNSNTPVSKTIKIGDKVVGVNTDEKMNEFGDACVRVMDFVRNKVVDADYFERVLHAHKQFENLGIYTELYAMVMTNAEGQTAVHPILLAKNDMFSVLVEVNVNKFDKPVFFEANDSIETVCKTYLHRGWYYEYIDYMNTVKVVKLPWDMPTPEKAVEIANRNNTKDISPAKEEKVEENSNMAEYDKNLDGALKEDEAKALAEITNNEPEVKVDDKPESEINKTFVIPSAKESEVKVEETETKDEVETEDNNVETESEVDETETKKAPPVIAKAYDGEAAKEGALNINNLHNDLEKELGDDAELRSDEEILEDMKAAVKSNIKVMKRIDLSNFSIDDTPISAAMVAGFSMKDINTADWVLPNAGKGVSVKGVNGPELFAMNPQNSNKNRINTFRQIYGIIYRHITSPKPSSFDEWLKVTRFSDIDHIYAALHKATFASSNYVHYECDKCQHIFLKDYNFDEDMVVYANDEAKARVQKIFNSGDFSIAGYEVQLHQISDNYVVGLKDPSIWNMVMETASLSEEFLEKYEDLLDTMSFIDSIYMINMETQKLQPIDFGYDKANPAKSTARKITILSDIIQTLPSDNYFELRTRIAELFQTSEDMTYQIPAAECPKCGNKIAAEPASAMQILFRRHQTGAIAAL